MHMKSEGLPALKEIARRMPDTVLQRAVVYFTTMSENAGALCIEWDEKLNFKDEDPMPEAGDHLRDFMIKFCTDCAQTTARDLGTVVVERKAVPPGYPKDAVAMSMELKLDPEVTSGLGGDILGDMLSFMLEKIIKNNLSMTMKLCSKMNSLEAPPHIVLAALVVLGLPELQQTHEMLQQQAQVLQQAAQARGLQVAPPTWAPPLH